MSQALEKWRERLNGSGLPVFARTVRDIGEVATSRATSAQDLSEVIGHDASMAARLIRIANSSVFNLQNRPIDTINSAVVLIGFDGVRELAVSVSVIEEMLKGNQHARLSQLMAHAFHAAAHAKFFAARNKTEHAEEVFVAALLKQVGEMAFWSRAGDEARDIENRLADGSSMASAEKEVLGFSLDALGQALADDWSLGELARKVHDDLEDADEMVACVNQAHALADLLETEEWNSRAVSEKLMELAKEWDVPVADVRDVVQSNMKDAAEIAERFGVPKRTASPGRAPRQVAPCKKTPPRKQNVDAERDYLRQIAQGLENDVSRDQLMQLIVDGVLDGVGCGRAYFLLLSADRSKLVAKYAAGEDAGELVGKSRGVEEPGAFAGVLEEKRVLSDIRVEASAPWHSQGSCLIAAVHIGKRPVGVLYGEVSDSVVDDDRQAGFRQFAQQVSLVLTQAA